MFSQLLENGGGCVRMAFPGTATEVWAAAQRECGGLGNYFCHLLYTSRYMFVAKQIQMLLLILGFYEMKSEQSDCLSGNKGSILSHVQNMLQKSAEGYIPQKMNTFPCIYMVMKCLVQCPHHLVLYLWWPISFTSVGIYFLVSGQ